MPEYDNSNRGALWATGKQGLAGKAKFGGSEFRAYLIATGTQNETAPSHMLFLDSGERDRNDAISIPLWRDDPGKPSFASGKYDGHFVNAYLNEVESGSTKPPISIQFKPMQKQSGGAGRPAPTAAGDDLPF